MRIGIYASLIAGERGHERNVSGHVQVPVHTARLLHEAGHDVHLITNRFTADRSLPEAITSGVTIHLVDDGRVRPKKLRGGKGRNGLRPWPLAKQLLQIRGIARRESFDVLHFFGLARTTVLAAVMRRMGPGCPVVSTMLAGNVHNLRSPLSRRLFRSAGHIFTATDYAAQRCADFGHPAQVVRHGIMRDLTAELGDTPVGPRNRVLFWRDSNKENGCDLCVEAYARVAPEFPDVNFDFAIRPSMREVPGVEELAAAHANINVFRFPYESGVSLPGLMAESLLVVLPFRSLTVDPQLSIAESLAAGVPVITTALRSNVELVHDGVGGALVEPDAGALADAMRRLLADRTALAALAASTYADFHRRWNWTHYVESLVDVYVRLAPRAEPANAEAVG